MDEGLAPALSGQPERIGPRNPDDLEFLTVGIDIGSSTTHLMFSRLVLWRMGDQLQSRYVVVARDTVYASPIEATPFLPDYSIDVQALNGLIWKHYAGASLTPEDVTSGAVILTGEAAKRTNARAISEIFAKEGGKFVCAVAGATFESVLAAHGSGAVAFSRTADRTVVNIDVGGGTSNIAVARGGRLIGTAAIAIGGRLIATNEDKRILRLESPGGQIASAVGADLSLGDVLEDAVGAKIAEYMADCLVALVGRQHLPANAGPLMLTPPLDVNFERDVVMFSGGVGEVVYGGEPTNFGDLTHFLAAELEARGRAGEFGEVVRPERGIRATVAGASQFTVEVSGNTIFVSDEEVLPLRNLRIVKPALPVPFQEPHPPSSDFTAAMARATASALEELDLPATRASFALAVDWPVVPEYYLLRALAEAITSGLASAGFFGSESVLVLVCKQDFGRSLGRILVAEFPAVGRVLAVDGIELGDLDYIDVGARVGSVGVVPVVVKSLVFDAFETGGVGVPKSH